MRRRFIFTCSLVFLSCACWSIPALAQDSYRLPPQDVVDIVDAPPAPSVRISPDGKWMLLVEQGSMPTIADLSRPMLRIAGLRIDPAANARYSTRFSSGLRLRPLHGGEEQPVNLPSGARIGTVSWSHDSEHFAYTLVSDQGTELWVGTTNGTPTKLTDRLSTVTGGFSWLPDGKRILAQLIPEGRGEAPVAPRAPAGPIIQSTDGNQSPVRTYQDLLKNQHDVALFDYHATTVPTILTPQGDMQTLGKAAVYASVSSSPNGELFLVRRIERPYSYLLPYWGFPNTTEVWDTNGQLVKTICETPARENIPIGGVAKGPRSVQWMANRPATVAWVTALDEGNPKKKVPHRDQWWHSAAPFTGDPHELFKVEHRARGLSYFENPNWVISSEYDRDRRWTRSLLHDLDQPGSPKVLEDRSSQDSYSDPGRIVSKTLANGRSVVRTDGAWIYRTGSGASPEGLLPFLDRQSLTSLATERLWRCEEGAYERVVKILNSSAEMVSEVVTMHETPTSPPNYLLRRAQAEDLALTEFPDPTPQLRNVHKQLVTYKRADGVELSATVYLPPAAQNGAKLPMLVWAYPREFSNAKTAGQVRTSPWRFTRVGGSSHLHLLTQGYMIMDGATMPIIGDPETMNDTFIEQLVASAQAAIDYAVEKGYTERNTVAIGGHSYGAFMTANLLAHCDLFQAGIARSGAYNRTLTPFGFQSERRSLWEAKDVYFNISPFMHANKINEPILLIHGEADNNSGTYPMQSRRLFAAVKGHGGTARLVMLPNESHGYRARESILHTLAETVDWLDRHVKPSSIVPAAHKKK